MKSKVEEEIERLEAEGIIRMISQAEWASPVVFVKKKNNSIWLCAEKHPQPVH